MDEINFVKDLAVILISAGIITIIFKALKQPLILGYIIAGFVIGPNMGVFGISSTETVELWSEIGMIFLMFGLGLEFSFKKLLKVGGCALVTAGSKFIGCFILGYIVGRAMGWTSMESIFLGGLLSMSSTLVIIKSYDEMGLKRRPFADIVFGTLVVEDLIAMLLMVLLSTMAATNRIEGLGMIENILKLVFFLTLWFVVGIYLIPTLLKKARRFINDEILLIVSLGLCFLMVFLAAEVGFSTALGAFVMGSILSETIEGEHIEKLIHPVKDLFGAIFFISVGMMLAPSVLVEHWGVILVVTLLVMVGQGIFAGMGVLLFGRGLDNAVYTGLSLMQLGEFGFIIAGVGVSMGVMRDFIYPVVIAVSVITIFVSPYVLKLAVPLLKLLRKRLPPSLLEKIELDQQLSSGAAVESEWKVFLRMLLVRLGLYSVILIAIYIFGTRFLSDFVVGLFPSWSENLCTAVITTVVVAAMLPFLYGLGVSSSDSMKKSVRRLREQNPLNTWPILGIVLLRALIAVGFMISTISHFVTLAGWVVIVILIGGLLCAILARMSLRSFGRFESRFMANFNAKDDVLRKEKPVTTSVAESLGAYNVHIEKIVLSPDSEFAGQRLIDLNIRENSGANIIKVTRGTHRYLIPSADFVLYPGDSILAVGTTEQLDALRRLFDDSLHSHAESEDDGNFGVESTTLGKDSLLVGKSLRELDLRKRGSMVISILHEGELITNPGPDFKFSAGDTVWIAGNINTL